MKFPLYSQIALSDDFPSANLQRGDLAIIVEFYQGQPGQESGYELEVRNALGETIDTVTVLESQIRSIERDTVLTVRPRTVVW